jgi:hypothetical protein
VFRLYELKSDRGEVGVVGRRVGRRRAERRLRGGGGGALLAVLLERFRTMHDATKGKVTEKLLVKSVVRK